MKELKILTQTDSGILYDGSKSIPSTKILRTGKLKTMVIESNCLDILSAICEYDKKVKDFIPSIANSCALSEFDPNTKFSGSTEDFRSRGYCVYGIQFYHIINQ